MDEHGRKSSHCCHTSTIQIVKGQTCCSKLGFQPPLKLPPQGVFPKSRIFKNRNKTSDPHMHHDILNVF